MPKIYILIIICFSFFIFISLALGKQEILPSYKSPKLPIKKRVEDLLSRMRLEEKIALLSGKDNMSTKENRRLGIPSLKMTDGSHGVRWGESICFPTGITMASTWNPSLICEMGKVLACETKLNGRNVLLGPCINIHRVPLGGRNFESFSEDPYLTAETSKAYIEGVQSENIAASVKHFICNNQEYQRFIVDVKVDERALREIYLPAFKESIKEADALTVMAAYNKVNGSYCCANKHLLRDILKDEWGFEGFVVSDWGATHSIVKSANAGLDLEMPGPGKYFDEDLLQAVKGGQVSVEAVNDKVRRILTVIFKLGLFDRKDSECGKYSDIEQRRKIAYKVAEEGIVLLKNENDLLPLKKEKINSIAVIGPNAKVVRVGGAGSSFIDPVYSISPYKGLKDKCHDKIRLNFAQGVLMPDELLTIPTDLLFPDKTSKTNGLKGEYFDNRFFSGEPVITRLDKKIDFNWKGSSPSPKIKRDNFSVRWTGIIRPKESGSYQLGLTSDDGSKLYINDKLLVDNWGDHGAQSRTSTIYLEKGKSYKVKIEYYENGGFAVMRLGYKPQADALLKEAEKVARNSDVVIIFAGLSDRIEGEEKDKEDMSLPEGQDELIEQVYKANKKTVVVLINGSPVRMDRWLDSVPSVIEAFYPGQEQGTVLADIIFGDINPSGKLPTTFPKRISDSASYGHYPGKERKVYYKEGIFVGYRHFDKNNIEPLFPFGYGLSYTKFKYTNLNITPKKLKRNNPIRVSLDVENIGEVKGKEVVQLYIHDTESSLPRPPKELKAFKKVNLKPNEKKTIYFELDKDSLHYYDPKMKEWVIEPGEFEVLIGSSSRDIRLKDSFYIK